ncbi:MAG: EAL domain-containing response regulator [Polyangiaceae bacterium]|nr:EAL domain-containing response regulator [Polyangiaceae bacterium]
MSSKSDERHSVKQVAVEALSPMEVIRALRSEPRMKSSMSAPPSSKKDSIVPGSGEKVKATPPRVLLVDDDPHVLKSLLRVLETAGYDVTTASNGADAVSCADKARFDVIMSDISMPNMDGIQLLREVREHDLHVPVILMTGDPSVSTAISALEYGALLYLTKPLNPQVVEKEIQRAVQVHRMARLKQQAAELLGNGGMLAADRAGLEASFERALENLWIAYQPILVSKTRAIYGYEALMRSTEPTLPHPGAMLDAADRLGALQLLGRRVRELAPAPLGAQPDAMLFVNLHVTDLVDPLLVDPNTPLAKVAHRVILEITERASINEVADARNRVAELREMGYRIAVDDMGAGYAGLSSFAQLEPEIVKLDMSLIRDVHKNSTKQKVVRSMTTLSQDMGMLVVAEGVEVPEERDVLIELGCDLLQGFLFAKPGRPFPEVSG